MRQLCADIQLFLLGCPATLRFSLVGTGLASFGITGEVGGGVPVPGAGPGRHGRPRRGRCSGPDEPPVGLRSAHPAARGRTARSFRALHACAPSRNSPPPWGSQALSPGHEPAGWPGTASNVLAWCPADIRGPLTAVVCRHPAVPSGLSGDVEILLGGDGIGLLRDHWGGGRGSACAWCGAWPAWSAPTRTLFGSR